MNGLGQVQRDDLGYHYMGQVVILGPPCIHSLYLSDNCSYDAVGYDDGFRTGRCLLRDMLVRKSI